MSTVDLGKDKLEALVEQAIKNEKMTPLDGFLSENEAADPFHLLCKANSDFCRALAIPNFDDWALRVDDWLDKAVDPRTQLTTESKILYRFWEFFRDDLTSLLRCARITGSIPHRGGVLAFVARLEKCIVMRYQFAGQWPHVRVVAIISNPRSAFDVWSAVDQADLHARNELKSILASGHKLVYHRGTLIHVDRRREGTVFGPSIDTILMSEVLAQDIYERSDRLGVRDVLEIGAGNGMLAAGAFRHLPNLCHLVCVDVDPSAINCTRKNLDTLRAGPGAGKKTIEHLIMGGYRPDLLSARFDLAICNPPYIPTCSGVGRILDEPTPDYLRAIGGLELLADVISAAPHFLTPSGRLLLMTSSLCHVEAQDMIAAAGLTASFPLGESGVEVLFDVEAVIGRPEWVEYLKKHGGIRSRDGVLVHSLHPVWLTHKS